MRLDVMHSMWSREASSAAPGTSVEGGLVGPGSQHSAALRHFFEHLLNRLLFDESPIELLEPSADALLALVLADERGFSELIQQVRSHSISPRDTCSSDVWIIHEDGNGLLCGCVRTMYVRVYDASVTETLSGRILRCETARPLRDPHDIEWTDSLIRPPEPHARKQVWYTACCDCSRSPTP